MNTQMITQNQSNELALMGNSLTMSSLEIAELTGKRHDNVMRDIKNMLLELKKDLLKFEGIYRDAYGRERGQFLLPKRETLILVSGYSVELRARIIDRWQELEAQVVKTTLPSNYIESLEALLESEKEKAQIALERDEAVRTKAHIGNTREATAMATASAAKRKANRLEAQLDESMQYASIKRMEMLYHGQKFNWRLLKSTGTEMGIQSIDIFDANYGTVKAYHADVWQEAYALNINAGATS